MRDASVHPRIPYPVSRIPHLVSLPDRRLETIRPHHRVASLASESVLKFGEVRQRSHATPAGRGVWVHDDLLAHVLVGGLGAPDLREREEEALLRGEAVDR